MIRFSLGQARGKPGDVVPVAARLKVTNAEVAATVNDILFDQRNLSIDPSTCRIDPALGKTVVATALRPGALRVFVESQPSSAAIPTGPIYTCSCQILPAAFPGTYSLTLSAEAAFDAAGTMLGNVSGLNGSVEISLVPLLGDLNHDGVVDGKDLPGLLDALFSNPPPAEADVNEDGRANAADLPAFLGQF